MPKLKCTTESNFTLGELVKLLNGNESETGCINGRHRNQIRLHAEIMMDYNERIRNHIELIYEMLPDHALQNDDSRSRRAIFQFLMPLYRSIYGLAGMSDIEAMKTTFKKAFNMSGQAMDAMQREIDDLTSISRITNNRTDLVIEEFHVRDKLITQTVHNVNNSLQSISSYMSLMFRTLHLYQKTERHLSDFVHSINNLVQGKLDLLIIHPSQLHKILTEIKTSLEIKFPAFHLISENALWFYKTSDNIAIRKGDDIYIFLKIPLSSTRNIFGVYEVQTFEIPVPDSNHTSRLTDIPEWILISQDRQQMVILNGRPQLQTGTRTLQDTETIERLDNSCVGAVFLNNAKAILQFCNPTLFHGNLKPSIRRLKEDSVLLININEYNITREGQTRSFLGCQFCIIKINCSWQISTKTQILPALFTQCISSNSDLKIWHATNFHILASMFELEEIKNLSSRLLEFPLEVILPEFNLADESNKFKNADQKLTYSLKGLAQNIKENKKIYDSSRERLENVLQMMVTSQGEEIQSWKDYLLLTLSGGMLLITGIMIYLIFKLKLTTALIGATAAIPKAVGQNVHPQRLIYEGLRKSDLQINKLTENITEITFHLELFKPSNAIQNFLLLVMALTFIYAALKLIKKSFKKKLGTEIYFNLSNNDNKNVVLKWQRLGDEVTQYRWIAEKFLEDINISWSIYGPRLDIVWGSLKIQHIGSGTHIPINKTKRLSVLQFFKIHRLIKNKYSVNIFTKGLAGNFYKVNIEHNSEKCNRIIEQRVEERIPAINPTFIVNKGFQAEEIIIPIYPTLTTISEDLAE